MGKAQPRATISGCDKFSFCGTIMGPIMILVLSINTQVWYRLARPDMQLGWPERKYNVVGATDDKMHWSQTYKMMKIEICAMYDLAQLQYGNPSGMMSSTMMMMTPLGEAMPCGFKPHCRSHMSMRCYWYWQLDIDAHVLRVGVGTGLGFMVAGMIIMLLSGNRDHRLYVVGLCCCGAMIVNGAYGWWVYDTDQFNMEMCGATGWAYAGLQGGGYYGSTMGATGVCCGCLATCCGLGAPEDSSDSEDEKMPMMGPPMGMM